jgi:ketosteroid isomerase-like protein
MIMRILVVICMMLILAALPRTCPAPEQQDSRDIEDHIWALETDYVSAYRDADHDAILALMHERFLGWPDAEDMPTAYGQVLEFLKERYGSPGAWDFRIERAGIRVQGDVAITHYVLVATANGAGDGGQARITRITHTWIRENRDWKILGGMSSVR